jgi:thioredoxin-like negative regulator of GroEL
MGRQQDALQTLNEALALSKDPGWLRIQFARVYAAKGMADEALAQLAPTAAWKPTFRIQAERARILAQAGRRREARALLDDLESRPESEASPDSLAFVHFALGDKDGGFDLLDRAVSQRLPGALWIKVDPRFDTVRTDPRFARLVERVGI